MSERSKSSSVSFEDEELGSEYYDESSERSSSVNKNLKNTARCIRQKTNFGNVKPYHLIDRKEFNPALLNAEIEHGASPKLQLLLDKIKALDENDMATSGKLYKHIIYTDVANGNYGTKIIASALSANGYNMIVKPQGTAGFKLDDDDKLLETEYNNFTLLVSKPFYNRQMNIKLKKSILARINSRPDNINGRLIRFIILDQGFKEGIDLFDIKYVHLFEPLVVKADETQAIGRGTRFCGQKGLEFHPQYGWVLYVYKYDLSIPANLQRRLMDSKFLFDYFIKNTDIDMKKIVFASELEDATIRGAVDYDLNKNIHEFAIENTPNLVIKDAKSKLLGGEFKNYAPVKKMNLVESREFIKKNFNKFKYPEIELKNNCVSGGGINGNIVNFTPTQDFVRRYFQPESAYKGILLHHSVGTGKTCTAIATATTTFDVEGYTILWVTRHTLKSDIWKNMFNQVCNIDIQNKLLNKELVLPDKISGPLKYMSKNWFHPISYKQFSNMLLKKNKIYDEIVKRNGKEDPLRKTLLIIDEAHKLYASQGPKQEKPNTDILESMIQNSYDKSKKDSVRVMLMTATPFTEDGMEMIKLLNLLRRSSEKIPDTFDKFSDKYLNEDGYFTKGGLKDFQDNISGYISYLNRSSDARNFAHPVIENISVDMTVEKEKVKGVNKFTAEKKEKRATIKELNAEKKLLKSSGKLATKECLERVKKEFEDNVALNDREKIERDAKCEKEKTPKELKECLKLSKQLFAKAKSDNVKSKTDKNKKCKEGANDGDGDGLQKIVDKIEAEKVLIKEIDTGLKFNKGSVKNIKEFIKSKKEAIKVLNQEKDKNVGIIKSDKTIKNKELKDRNKEIMKEIKDIRSDIVKENNKIKSFQTETGKNIFKNISIDYNISKCLK
jgi:hypothetical protein